MAKKISKSDSKNRRKTILLGFAQRQRGPSGKWRIRFLWGRIFGTLALLAVLGYLAGATAIFFYFKERKGYKEVSYLQVLALPFNMENFQRQRGDYEIAEAKKYLKENDIRQAYFYLRSRCRPQPDQPGWPLHPLRVCPAGQTPARRGDSASCAAASPMPAMTKTTSSATFSFYCATRRTRKSWTWPTLS